MTRQVSLLCLLFSDSSEPPVCPKSPLYNYPAKTLPWLFETGMPWRQEPHWARDSGSFIWEGWEVVVLPGTCPGCVLWGGVVIPSTGFQCVLQQTIRVCGHYRWSYPASVSLAKMHCQFLTVTCCNIPTCWNSTLANLHQLHQQQWAIN